MANFYSDNDDLKFYVDHYIDWPELVDLTELHFNAKDAPKDWKEAVGGYRDVLELVGQFVADEVAPRARALDAEGMHLGKDGAVQGGPAHETIFAALKEMGVYGLCVPRELGGMNFPTMVYFLVNELFARGDVSTMTHFAFHTGTAAILTHYSLHEGSAKLNEVGAPISTRFDAAIQEIMAGNAWGSMDLTEPGAGSDLAQIRTRARLDANGVWRVTGNKIFITSGHGKYHLVLAKTEDQESLEALSLFVVPTAAAGADRLKGYVDRVEEKIGHHGSATCSVQFEDAEAMLIGAPGEGFKLMLLLMNNARIGVGFEGIGLSEAAVRMARDYAASRRTMGKTIDSHELIADYLDEMETTVQGLRALAVEGAIAEEMGTRLEYLHKQGGADKNGADTVRRIRRLKRRARLVTPLIKFASAEFAVWIARMNMQIHGGYGYVRDYDAERLLRDALVLPIYEGTSQIQALMALKDHLGAAVKSPQRFLQKLAAAKLEAVSSRDKLERTYWTMRSQCYSALQHILLRTARDKWSTAISAPLPRFLDSFLKEWDPRRDFSYGLLHAEHLARMLADVEIAGALLAQARRFGERREIALRFMERAEPRVHYNWDLVVHTGERVLGKVRRAADAARASATPTGGPDAVTTH
ncbi:MAG: acyl-CoA dehydrogenase family protein [Deltaproteobacteria bacterium]|nr:acyl-CoA dehydrogenase family protein [Deltaproteobacteria bacterium]